MKPMYALIATAISAVLSVSSADAETVTFETLTAGVQTPGSLTFPDVVFTSSSGEFSVISGKTGQALCAYQLDCSATLTIDFLNPASNVSFIFFGDDSASTLSFEGESTTASFHGRIFADGNPDSQDLFNLSIVPNITQLIVFTDDPGGVVFDNLSFTTSGTAAVPEPAAWAMMISGFGTVGGLMRRRNKVAPAVKLA